MKDYPLIGVAGSYDAQKAQQFVLRAYLRSILNAGGLPVLLSMDMEGAALDACLDKLDGLLMAGGCDIDPTCYHEEKIDAPCDIDPLRDRFELELLKRAIPRRLPILGICRGIQVMNVAMGGTLYQDLPAQLSPESAFHRQSAPTEQATHFVTAIKDTRLHGILGGERLMVNSTHHQAVKDAAPGLTVCARADDGVIEAIESAEHPFFLGVQWHPERQQNPQADALFRQFIAACAGA